MSVIARIAKRHEYLLLIALAILSGSLLAASFLRNFDRALFYCFLGAFGLMIPYLMTHPRILFLAGILAFPFTRIGAPRLGFFTLQASQLFGVMLCLVIFAILIQKRDFKRFFDTPLTYAMMIFLGTVLFSIAQSISIPPDYSYIPMAEVSSRNKPFVKSLTQIAWMLIGMVWFMNTFYIVRSIKETGRAIKYFLATAVGASLFGIYQMVGYFLDLPFAKESMYLRTGVAALKYGNATGKFVRVSSFYTEPSHLAVFLIAPLTIAAMIMVFKNDFIRSRLARFFILVLISTCFVFTFSRTGMILGCFLICSIIFIRRVYKIQFIPKLTTKIFLMIVFGLATAELMLRAVSGTGLFDILKNQYYSIFAPTSDNYSNLQRLGAWLSAAAIFLKHPIFGVGIGNYIFHVPMNSPSWMVIDEQTAIVNNIYLEILAETGIIGFAAFSYLVFKVLKELHIALRCETTSHSNRVMLAALLAGFGGILVGHIFMSAFYFPFVWFFIGLIFVYTRSLKYEKLPGSPPKAKLR